MTKTRRSRTHKSPSPDEGENKTNFGQMMEELNAIKKEIISVKEERRQQIQPKKNTATTSTHNVGRSGEEACQIQIRSQIHDLPSFSGKCEEWPMFIATYEQSSRAFQYTNLENMMRLQKCLKGDAREAVEYMLIYPDNVEEVINELKFRFGQPQRIIKSQIESVKHVQPIKEKNLHLIVPFSTKVKNLVSFIEAADAAHYLNNTVLLEELIDKLPMSRKIEWAQYANKIEGCPTVKDFGMFLEIIAKLIYSVTFQSEITHNQKPKPVLHSQNVSSKDVVCILCQGSHKLFKCQIFTSKAVNERWQIVKQNKLCFACLNKGHNLNDCRFKMKCNVNGCNLKHNKLLHEQRQFSPPAINSPPPNNAPPIANMPLTNYTSHIRPPPANLPDNYVLNFQEQKVDVLFRILPVILYGRHSQKKVYALFDEGSSVTLIDEQLANELKLEGKSETLHLQWYGSSSTTETSRVVNCQISGISQSSRKLNLSNARTVNSLNLPKQSLNVESLGSKYSHLKGLPIDSYEAVQPRLLIGLDNGHLGVTTETNSSYKPESLIVTKTQLGYVVYGPLKQNVHQLECHKARVMTITHEEEQQLEINRVEELAEEYFSTESYGVSKSNKPLVPSEIKRAVDIMEATTRRSDDRFETGLLWKYDNFILPNSFDVANRRLKNLQRKLSNNPRMLQQYEDKLVEYEKKGYARQLTPEEITITTNKTWYLPHFFVLNPNKPGKIRIVFDAAAKVNGSSLNDMLLTGPDINQPLLDILFKFRQKSIGLCADIQEMFSQVKINESDQQAQRFLWQRDGKLQVFVMTRMIFGATCSPSLAQYIKNKNALEHLRRCPDGAKAVIEKHYVDDYVDSFGNEDEALKIAREVKEIHRNGGFLLHHFVSNSRTLSNKLNMKDDDSDGVSQADVWHINKSEKILGLYWCTASDTFKFVLKFGKIPEDVLNYIIKPTKRQFLSFLMSIFDPFGFLASLLIHGKLLLQQTFQIGINWDEQIPDNVYNKWKMWHEELNKVVPQISIKRCYSDHLFNDSQKYLHIFVDASEAAYAAAAYLVLKDNSNCWKCVFIAGKTKCAPKKVLTVPRLELEAAVLATRLKNLVVATHAIKFNKYTFWSDSKTVIKWINANYRDYKPFVTHRIAEILESSNANDWKWVPSHLNVADEATRAKYPINYKINNKWIEGPEFLVKDQCEWPILIENDDQQHVQEIRAKAILHIDEILPIIDAEKFSKYERLLRTTAWALRFLNNCRPNVSSIDGELTVHELKQAETHLCIQSQKQSFSKEYDCLLKNEPLDQASTILNLPCLDKNKMMRAKGRIDAATTVPITTRRPIILNREQTLAKLIVDYYHRKNHHQNNEMTICDIRERFWIPGLRVLLKTIISKCQKCKNDRTKPSQPIMGPLPEDRLTPYVFPFTYTGLDYFGPVTVTIGRSQVKRYVALFTCLTIRAIHLEIASDLSTDACILCIRNFINRRGVPLRIRSDNGTNFVGVNNEVMKLDDFLDHNQVQAELGRRNIEWVFNCPSNPSSGGCWERLVQSVKKVLRVTLKEVAPKPETLYSLLTEAENIINLRPLTHLPVTADEPEPLTPNHFLLGRTNSTQTPAEPNKRLMNSRKQWRIAQQLKNHFWRRWVREYLPDLTRRTKWNKYSKPIQVNDVVIITDENQPRSRWLRGKVVRLFKCRDNVIRIVDVKTVNGISRRPVNKLAVLDVLDGESTLGDPRGAGC